MGPEGVGPEGWSLGWSPEGWSPEGWGPEGWGPEGWLPKISRFFFSLSRRKFHSSFSGGSSRGILVFEAPAHGPRLYVCQAPNAFICVLGVAPLPKHQMRSYVCHQMHLYVCHQLRLHVCHQMRLHVCHQMRLLNPQRSSLRSLTFARFARTFFLSKLEFLSKEHSCLSTDSCLNTDSCVNTDSCLNTDSGLNTETLNFQDASTFRQ